MDESITNYHNSVQRDAERWRKAHPGQELPDWLAEALEDAQGLYEQEQPHCPQCRQPLGEREDWRWTEDGLVVCGECGYVFDEDEIGAETS